MARRPCLFKEADLRRAFKAARAAGVRVKIKIKDGKMTVVMGSNSATESEKNKNEWDEVFDGKDQT